MGRNSLGFFFVWWSQRDSSMSHSRGETQPGRSLLGLILTSARICVEICDRRTAQRSLWALRPSGHPWLSSIQECYGQAGFLLCWYMTGKIQLSALFVYFFSCFYACWNSLFYTTVKGTGLLLAA